VQDISQAALGHVLVHQQVAVPIGTAAQKLHNVLVMDVCERSHLRRIPTNLGITLILGH